MTAAASDDARDVATMMRDWFVAWEQANLHDAAALCSPDLVCVAPDGSRYDGFVAFAEWYADRRETLGDSFTWRLEEMFTGPTTAVGIFALSTATERWRQAAVYDVRDGLFTTITLIESPPTPTDA